MMNRLLAIASATIFFGFAFAPSAVAQATVVADTYDSSATKGNTGDGTYKKKNPAEGEENLRITFTEKTPTPEEQESGERRYSWTLKKDGTAIASGTLTPA